MAPRKPRKPRKPDAARETVAMATYERVADTLAANDGIPASKIAGLAEAPVTNVRRILLDMESRGIAVRTGRKRGTLWHLG